MDWSRADGSATPCIRDMPICPEHLEPWDRAFSRLVRHAGGSMPSVQDITALHALMPIAPAETFYEVMLTAWAAWSALGSKDASS